MAMSLFQFKQFSITQEHSALKLGTDAMLLGALTDFEKPSSIIDIGTGIGILALMMAQKHLCPITAIDIDDGAICDAQQNCTESPWHERISVECRSLQDFSNETENKFDGIICNPPFFTNSLPNPSIAKTMARHTVSLTPNDLFCGIHTLLTETGIATINIPTSEKQLFIESAQKYNLHSIKEVAIYPFATSEGPNRAILSFSKKWSGFQRTQIHIREKDNNYTSEYKDLTKDFYIKL